MAEGRYGHSEDRVPGVEVQDCKDCGALVVDTALHDRFHDRLDALAAVKSAEGQPGS